VIRIWATSISRLPARALGLPEWSRVEIRKSRPGVDIEIG
jgi:hypothetical protein